MRAGPTGRIRIGTPGAPTAQSVRWGAKIILLMSFIMLVLGPSCLCLLVNVLSTAIGFSIPKTAQKLPLLVLPQRLPLVLPLLALILPLTLILPLAFLLTLPLTQFMTTTFPLILWRMLAWLPTGTSNPLSVMNPPLPVPEPLMLLLVAYLAWSLELD